jgi:molecular chaperone GrpE
MSEKENSTEEASLEEAIAEIAEEQPDDRQGDEPDHVELTALLEDARGKADEHWDQCMRLQADIENLRKRAERDLANAHKYGLERFAAELLPVKDSLEMGLAAFDTDNAEIEKLKEGAELTLQMLGNALERFEIKEVNPQDEPFNPDFHQAMSMQPRDDVAPNTVVTVVQKGYLLHDRLIRPAMVIVSQAPATS